MYLELRFRWRSINANGTGLWLPNFKNSNPYNPGDEAWLKLTPDSCAGSSGNERMPSANIMNDYNQLVASQIIRSGTRSGTTPVPYPRSIPPFHTPVPYPRSIPPFHTCLKDPFHTSVPYLWAIRYDIYIYMYIYTHYLYKYIYVYMYICIFEHVQSDLTFVRTYLSAHTYMSVCMQEYVCYAQALWLCWQVCACSTSSGYLVCSVMVGMCLAAASWQSKNGLLVTLPPSQPVAGSRLHHLHLLPAVAQLWCLMVEMRLAVASWQSKNCLLRYTRSKLPILIKMCCVVAGLCWSGPFRPRPRSIPFHMIICQK